MANLHNITSTNNNNNIYSSSGEQQDEISVFLQQILLRSSSSSSSAFMQQQPFSVPLPPSDNQEPTMVPGPGPGRIYVSDPLPGPNPSSAARCSSSSFVGTFDNDPDEYDYESEEAAEAVVGEALLKPSSSRNSSKRSRAAEVHNLSEKRRRSRINEKMKALQNLIPNSNKTDKASMLDEAIEYLKQLQLQVQMLTMRNGLSLYPFSVPGMLQPNQISQITRNNKSLNTNNMAKSIPMDHQNINMDAHFSVQDNNNCVKPGPIADFSTMIGSKTSFEMESSSIQDQFGHFQFSKLSKGICGEKVVPCRPQNEEYCPQTSSKGKGYFRGGKSTSFDMKEACLAGSGDRVQSNFVNNPIFSSHLDI